MKTVLGEIRADALGVTLPHEHICCYNEYALRMMGERYLDKDALRAASVAYLKEMKKKYSLSTVFDCTPVNIGRDIDLLRRVSEESEINIATSTGFYYTDEPSLYSATAEMIAEYILTDAKATNAAIIKCAVEREEITPFLEKVLRACAMAHRECGLPIVMHSNARNKNARAALEILFLVSSTPILSIGSLVLLIPAVSASLKGILPSITVSSTTSRVVPAKELTILLSQPDKRFIRVLLPAFGLPAITIFIPSLIILPASKLLNNLLSSSSVSDK